MRVRALALASGLLAAAAAVVAQAQSPFEFWPGVRYDAAIPTMAQVLGHEPGARITAHAEILAYLRALEAAAPRQLTLVEYGRTWEGRPLVYVMIGSESNIARLDEIKAGMRRLGDPRETTAAEAETLVTDLPAIAWLSYGVHGNEISSPDAALLTAYHLLAARGDAVVDEILASAVVAIDPTQNPDGRDRFVQHYRVNEGLEPADSPDAAEHTEQWPGGRTNHYYFDLNRDWFALTQPEVRGRVRNLLEAYPVVHVDLHEMGANSTYYFAPAADPYNPHMTEQQKASLELFGRGNAAWFDRFGFDYFTREVYDAFYPGYGDSWPIFLGAAGMTYEQASARGMVMRRNDGTDLHFRDAVRQHFVASVATAQTAARNRETLLRDLHVLRRSGMNVTGRDAIREYILPLRGDASAVRKLAGVLVEQGIEVRRSVGVLRACGQEYPAGSFSVSLAQPSSRLARTLLDPDNPLEPEFRAEQERRRAKNLSAEIYDVTAWSLPQIYNVESIPCASASGGELEAVGPDRLEPGAVAGGDATVAYLVPWGTAAAGRFLTAALRADLRVRSSDKGFVQNEVTFPGGTLILEVADNDADLHETVRRLAADSGADVIATDTSWVDEGVNFGSRFVNPVRQPGIALAWDRPTSANAAGATRFVLERQFGYPVTPIRTQQLGSADLSRFHVLILPNGSGYADVLGDRGLARIKAWVDAGGVLIGLDGAMTYLAHKDVDLLAVRQETLAEEEETDAPEEDEETGRVAGRLFESRDQYLEAIAANEALPDEVPGVLVKASIDRDHWITAGLPETLHVMVDGRAIYTPITLDKGVNAVTFLGADELLAGGFLWEENRKQLAFKPFVIVQPRGRGFVIGFTADPNFRAFMDGLNVLFLNAVFGGAAHATPMAASVSAGR